MVLLKQKSELMVIFALLNHDSDAGSAAAPSGRRSSQPLISTPASAASEKKRQRGVLPSRYVSIKAYQKVAIVLL
jgi:hypothetical protein